MFGGMFATSRQRCIPADTAMPCSIARSPTVSSRRVGTLNTNLRSGRRVSPLRVLSASKLYKLFCVLSTASRTFQYVSRPLTCNSVRKQTASIEPVSFRVLIVFVIICLYWRSSSSRSLPQPTKSTRSLKTLGT